MDYIIRYGLAEKGYTWTRIARELGLASGPSVSEVVKGKYPSERVERRVADILEKHVGWVERSETQRGFQSP